MTAIFVRLNVLIDPTLTLSNMSDVESISMPWSPHDAAA